MATASLMTLSLSCYHSSIKSVQRSVVDGLLHRLLNNVAIMIGYSMYGVQMKHSSYLGTRLLSLGLGIAVYLWSAEERSHDSYRITNDHSTQPQ